MLGPGEDLPDHDDYRFIGQYEGERICPPSVAGLYIFVPGAPPSAIHAGVVTAFVLVASPSDARSHLCTVRTDNAPKVRFSATVGQEPEIELALS